jgi:hypothetical protein
MTEPAPRRRLPLPLLIGVAALAAAAVGIPVGLATGSRNEPPPSTAPAVTRPGPVARTAAPVDAATPEPTPSDAGSSTLTSDQAALRDRMTLDGVLSSTCTGYPAGEQGFTGVVASIECDIADPRMNEPIVYYQFDGADSVASYVRARAADVDVAGDCDQGDEADGYWSAGGVRRGELVCVENVKGDRTLFKLVYSSFGDGTVAVVQDESAGDVLAWARTHGRQQFAGT